MDRFNALGRGMQIMLVAGVLLLIDTFLPWQKVTVSILGVEAASVKASGWHGFLGVAVGLLTIILVAWLVARLAAVDIPLPVSSAMTGATLAVLIFIFALIKNLADDYSTIWSLHRRDPGRAARSRGLAPGAGVRRRRDIEVRGDLDAPGPDGVGAAERARSSRQRPRRPRRPHRPRRRPSPRPGRVAAAGRRAAVVERADGLKHTDGRPPGRPSSF